jgi:hypothetical protein
MIEVRVAVPETPGMIGTLGAARTEPAAMALGLRDHGQPRGRPAASISCHRIPLRYAP